MAEYTTMHGIVAGPQTAFDSHAAEYDAWYDRHTAEFDAEVRALRTILPVFRRGIEIGAGTGRFAQVLGFPLGLEPSSAMAALARARGIDVVSGIAESLPFEDGRFDCVLMVASLCFVNNPSAALREIYRVLTPGGHFVLGIIDGDSALGRRLSSERRTNPFYRNAVFRSSEEVLGMLAAANLIAERVVQTLLETNDRYAIEPGCGRGGFVAVAARKPEAAL